MKLALYQSKDGGPRAAAVLDDTLVDLNAADPNVPACTKAILTAGKTMLRRAEEASRSGSSGNSIPLGSVELLPPIAEPPKILCVGANYAEHIKEVGEEQPEVPILFCKLPTALNAPGEPVILPSVSQKVDYEAEFVIVIGRQGRDIAEADAMDYVAGYTCGNDVSARDWQLEKPGGQWLLGKSFDTFAPVGPWIVTADEITEPGNLDICLRLNGQVMQLSNTRHFIFPIAEVIAYVSQVCTLMPGDLIFTGTPDGVGLGRKPPVFLKSGDTMEVDIEKIGVLKNPVV